MRFWIATGGLCRGSKFEFLPPSALHNYQRFQNILIWIHLPSSTVPVVDLVFASDTSPACWTTMSVLTPARTADIVERLRTCAGAMHGALSPRTPHPILCSLAELLDCERDGIVQLSNRDVVRWIRVRRLHSGFEERCSFARVAEQSTDVPNRL